MPTIPSNSGRNESLATTLEDQFETHTVEAQKIRDRFGEDSNAADWGVICVDCGRAQDFFLTSNQGEVTISDVFIDSLEEKPCEPYEIPDDVHTGEHDLVVHTENPATIANSRHVHCRDCGRTTIATRNPEYAGNYIDRLGDFICSDSFSDEELTGAVLYSSIPAFPNPEEVGIDNWNSVGGSHGWGKDIASYWWHPQVPITIVMKGRNNCYSVQFNLVQQRLNCGTGTRPPGGITTRTLGGFQYKSKNNDTIDTDKILKVLTFMQATNDYDEEAFNHVHSKNEPTFSHIVENNSLETRTES